MRQVILDTETTGLKPEDGNRIIEIGCIEVLNRQATGNTFQRYLNPDRDIEDGAFRVHGLSRDFLSDKERFADIHDDFLHFVGNATIVIHNAPFDLAFLDAEFTRMDRKKKNPLKKNKIIDSLLIARKLHPGQRNSLDALAKRYEINSYDRSLHGALLDAQILADVYLTMTGGQVNLLLEQVNDAEASQNENPGSEAYLPKVDLISVKATDLELTLHQDWIKKHFKV
jgi:DNA polymerase-3 subunit epsilon